VRVSLAEVLWGEDKPPVPRGEVMVLKEEVMPTGLKGEVAPTPRGEVRLLWLADPRGDVMPPEQRGDVTLPEEELFPLLGPSSLLQGEGVLAW